MPRTALSGPSASQRREWTDGRLVDTGETFELPADQLFKAIGQAFVPQALDGSHEVLELEGGRIAVDAERRTSLPGVWAGGDCVAGGKDLTVAAVEDGKQALCRSTGCSRASCPWRRSEGKRHGRSPRQFLRHQIAEPVLAGLRAADRQGLQRRARLQGRLGRRGLEDARAKDPPIVNVNGPRYGAFTGRTGACIGFNNIELITDRPLEVNLHEIKPR